VPHIQVNCAPISVPAIALVHGIEALEGLALTFRELPLSEEISKRAGAGGRR